MAYGSGTPGWSKNDGQQGGLNNRYQSAQSYQSSSGGTYQPPQVNGSYADQQTQVVEDTMRTNYQAEGTAAEVLSQMTTQRQQLQGAQNNVWQMREATEKAKREISDLAAKQRKKKLRLKMIAGSLAAVDLILFLRIAYCGGSFFCRHYSY